MTSKNLSLIFSPLLIPLDFSMMDSLSQVNHIVKILIDQYYYIFSIEKKEVNLNDPGTMNTDKEKNPSVENNDESDLDNKDSNEAVDLPKESDIKDKEDSPTIKKEKTFEVFNSIVDIINIKELEDLVDLSKSDDMLEGRLIQFF